MCAHSSRADCHLYFYVSIATLLAQLLHIEKSANMEITKFPNAAASAYALESLGPKLIKQGQLRLRLKGQGDLRTSCITRIE